MAERAGTIESTRDLRRRSKKARVIAPPPAPRLRMPKQIHRLQRHAPMYAMQGLSELSTRLRELTGREVIDMNRVMELIQFAYQQRELAKRGADYVVDDFGFDPQWTESFLTMFKALYHDYWRVETTGIENVPTTGRALLVANHAGVLPWDGAMITTSLFVEHPTPRHVRALVATAIRAQAPIIPISVVGSEEIYPMIADATPVARMFGLPYFPITPFWPWLGVLGMIPLPSKWRIQFHAAVHVEEQPPSAADDQNLVLALSDQVRDTIQKGVYDNLKLRRGVFA